jgi:hypothetical protein
MYPPFWYLPVKCFEQSGSIHLIRLIVWWHEYGTISSRTRVYKEGNRLVKGKKTVGFKAFSEPGHKPF